MRLLGIYTIKSNNYGNRLQNYATQYFLESHGFKVETIGFFSPNDKIRHFKMYHPMLAKVEFLVPMLIRIKDAYKSICKKDSTFYFNQFEKNIKHSKEYIGFYDYSDGMNKFDTILVGSDQVWNTEFNMISINSFLPFEHPSKVAWSASFGVERIEYNDEIISSLNSYKALSVRENAGAEIIKCLIGKEATVLVDPTMLLSANEWRNISRKPKGVEEDYILTYFLSPKCAEAQEKLQSIQGSMKVYEILNAENEIGNKVGPAEFLYLFDHAKIILTDSFHACVFAFLFDKPFIVYDRNWNESKMNSRLDTFLCKFALERKYASSNMENDIWEHEYTQGYRQLEIERKRALKFLIDAIENNG